jgi:putative ABC transport system permease protein
VVPRSSVKMNPLQLIGISFRALLHHKGRSLLTILGIIIGIGSIVALLAIGKGAEQKIRSSILSSGTNFIYVSPGWPPNAKHGKQQKTILPITAKHTEILKKLCPTVRHVSPMSYISAKVRNQSISESDTMVNGCSENYMQIGNCKILKGSFIQQHHVQKVAKVIVLGYEISKTLFKNINPLGQMVEVNKTMFTIIGVLEKIENPGEFMNRNKECYLPFTTVKKYLKNSFDDIVNGVFVSSKSLDLIPETVRCITKVMRVQHKLGEDDANDFNVFDQHGMLKAAGKASSVFSIFLLIVALISLLIGGIGVMNIMLVSVGERTQEIGIRMAIGATEKTIRNQFLLESLTLCTIGGVFGVILGIVTPMIASYFTGWITVITPSSIVIAVITMFLVGLIFGYYPAYKASKMNPINALIE